MNKIHRYLFFVIMVLAGCKKDFLDSKPNSNIVNPTNLSEYQELLDNYKALNSTGALPQMSCDEYFIINQSSFDALGLLTYKGAYLWSKDLYGGETNIQDWNGEYKSVFYANSVLDGISQFNLQKENQTQYNNIKGEALFFRAYAFYDLATNFCPVYNVATSKSDLGIPLRLTSGIDYTLPRSSLQATFDQIVNDLQEASTLLQDDFSFSNRNRPCKSAVDAMLARVYLYMGNYNAALTSANACLNKYNKLIDYNSVSQTSATPFSYSTDETIFFSVQQYTYTSTTGYAAAGTAAIGVDTNLIKLYSVNDLRFPIFFAKNTLGNYNVKRGYVGGGFYAFTGLATDEIMLIKAECAARLDDPSTALSTLNTLLSKRYQTGTFTPISAPNSTEALNDVLQERRKELVWRAIRWSDLKRLNRDGANIPLHRILGGVTYILPPNSPLYVFPIPSDEIALSGIQQNSR